MLKSILISSLIFLLTTCSNDKSKDDRVHDLLNKILSDSLTFDEKIKLIDTNNVFDSLEFNQKKMIIIDVMQLKGWEIDHSYSEKELDSILLNTNMKEYIKLYWLTNELDSCILK